MYEVSLPTFLAIVIPQFALIFTIQSQALYHRLNLVHLVAMVILATCCSALFGTIGEIIFAFLYCLFLVISRHTGCTFLFALMWEFYLIIENLIALITQVITHIVFINFDLATGLLAIVFNTLIILSVIFGRRFFEPQFSNVLESLGSDTLFGRAFVFYSGIICSCLYLIQYVYEQMNIAIRARWFTTGIFMVFMVINLISLYFIKRTIKISVENQMLHAAEKAKQQYYEDLETQQDHTEKILHDYKNILGALQISLDDNDSLATRSDVKSVLQQAQASLNTVHPNGSALASVMTISLRSLIYLKWTQASTKKILLNIQSSGKINITNQSLLMASIRASGILIDNAIEATPSGGQIDLLLTQANSDFSITIINTVPPEFNVSDLNKPGYTSKGEGHGHGMSNLQEIIRSHHEINLIKQVLGTKLKITLIIEVA